MKPVDPRIDPRLVPQGSRAVVIAKRQKEYTPLPCIRTPNFRVISRWEPTHEEREAIARGADLFLTVLADGPVQPVLLTVGTDDAVVFWNDETKAKQAPSE